MDELALYIGVPVIIAGVLIWGLFHTGDLGVTRQKEPIAKTELCALSDGSYIADSDGKICWCTLEGKEVKVMRVRSDYVKIIKDSENKVYIYEGTHKGIIMGVYHMEDKVKVYEIHTDKPIVFIKADGLGKALQNKSHVKTEKDNTEEVKFK